MTPGPGAIRPRVAVIGHRGVVGSAQVRMLEAVYDVTGYDTSDRVPYPAAEIAGCEFAVICAGTPATADGSADLLYLRQALAALPPGVPVLIRSTMPPGTMDVLATGTAPAIVAHAPEFMHERAGGAWPETTDVPFLILGGNQDSRDFFRPHLAQFFPKIHECDALTAELVKYTVNLHLAARITFINEMDGICRAFGADWENVREAWLNDPRITPEYTGGIAEFGPGFGGRCWPKDLSAMIAAAQDAGYEAQFLRAIRGANWRFRQDTEADA